MFTRSIPTLIALGMLAMRLAADVANLVNEPGRRAVHALLVAAVLAAIVGVSSRRLAGWCVAVAYCGGQTLRYGVALYTASSFVGFMALVFMLICTVLLLHPEARSEFG